MVMRAHLFSLAALAAGLVALSAQADTDEPFTHRSVLPPLAALPPLRPLVALVPFGPSRPVPTPAPVTPSEPESPYDPPAASPPAAHATLAPGPPSGMVSVPGASAVTLGQYDEYHRPIAAYAIDGSAVSIADYQRCIQAGKCTPPSCGGGIHEAPVTCVDAKQAGAYCAFAGARLPTEDEWEHAAREARTLGLGAMGQTTEWTGSPYCFFCGKDDQVVRGGPARNPALRGWRAPTTRDAGIGFRCAR
jgi:formylglycine-generating enzyme required for sulfatase activity